MKNPFANHVLLVLLFAIMPIFGIYAASPATPIGLDRPAFEVAVRNLYRLHAGADIRQHALARAETASRTLRSNPSSHLALRDLADAYHTLGHIEEFAENYSKAIEYHSAALESYSLTPVSTRESYQGTVHAVQHIFVDMYENAYQSRQHGYAQSDFLFRKALFMAREKELINSVLINTESVYERYLDLLRRAPDLLIPLTPPEESLLNSDCGTLIGHRRN